MARRAYHIRSKYGDKVGSCFPELLAKVPGCASSTQARPVVGTAQVLVRVQVFRVAALRLQCP